MPVYRNDNSHGINPTGSRRIPPGAAFQVTDDEAGQYDGLNNVTKLEGQEAEDALAPRTQEVGDSIREVEAIPGDLRKLARSAAAATLQRVVGDDEAPMGPPTGTITTKRVQAQKSVADRLAFAQGEALEAVSEPEDKTVFSGREKSQVVHNAQAEAGALADEVARDVLPGVEGDGAIADAIESVEEAVTVSDTGDTPSAEPEPEPQPEEPKPEEKSKTTSSPKAKAKE